MQVNDTVQQIKDIFTNPAVKRVLVTSGKNVDPDALGSALAVASVLDGMEKQVTVAIDEFDASKMQFLPGIERVQSSIGQKSLVVSIDVGANPIERINYNSDDTKFNLILTPKAGQVDVDQIQYSYAGLSYDAIVVVDTAAKTLLGDWIEGFSKELRDIPLINIDHHADNGLYGTLNLVQSDKASATIVVYELLKSLEQPLNREVLTNLLAGILSDTNGFVNRNADATSLQIAAELVAAGADLHGMTQALFKTMNLPALRLWGRVLSRVEMVDPGIVITDVQLEDIATTGATEADQETLSTIVNTYIPSVPNALVGVVLKEKEDGEVSGSLRSINPRVNVQAMAAHLGGGGHIVASGFKIENTTLSKARESVIKIISDELQKQSISPEKGSEKSDENSDK